MGNFHQFVSSHFFFNSPESLAYEQHFMFSKKICPHHFVFQHVKWTQSSMKMSLFSCENGNLCTSWQTFSRLIIRTESDAKEAMHKLSRLAQKRIKKTNICGEAICAKQSWCNPQDIWTATCNAMHIYQVHSHALTAGSCQVEVGLTFDRIWVISIAIHYRKISSNWKTCFEYHRSNWTKFTLTK